MSAVKTRKKHNVTLTDSQIKNTKPDPNRQIKLADNGGLYVLVKPNGSKGWRWKFYLDGRERCMSFGPYPAVSLKEARNRRDAAREQVQAGIDPVKARAAEKAERRAAVATTEHTFKSVADEYLKLRAASTGKVTQDKQKFFLAKLAPLHSRPILQIQTPEVIDACQKIQAELQKAPDKGSDTARRAASLARRVFDHAANLGIITDGRNPAATSKATLFPLDTTHHAAVTDPVEIGKLLASIDEYSARSPVVEYALKIIPYIFVRPYEQRHLRWEWVDFKASTLIVPNKYLKRVKGDDRSDHYVPLAPKVAKLFKQLHDVTGDGPYVFPSMTSRNRAMSDNAITSALRRMGYSGDVMTWHGFRTIASTRLNELGYAPDLIEVQLAHKPAGGAVRDAYNRATYLKQRRAMMTAYADHLNRLRETYWLGS